MEIKGLEALILVEKKSLLLWKEVGQLNEALDWFSCSFPILNVSFLLFLLSISIHFF